MRSRFRMFNKLNVFMNSNKKKMLLFVFASCLCILPDILYPFVYKYFIDSVLTVGVFTNIKIVIFGFLSLLVLKIIFSYLLIFSRNKFLRKSTLLLKIKLLKNYFHTERAFKDITNPTEIKTIIDEDSKAVNTFYTNQFATYLTDLIKLVTVCSIMIYLNFILFCLCLLFFVFSLLQTQRLRKNVVTIYDDSRNMAIAETEKLRQNFGLWREVKLLNIEDKVIEDYDKGLKKIAKLNFQEKLYEFYSYYFGALNNTLISNFFVYMVGGLLIVSNQLAISSFLVFLGFYSTATGIIQSIISSNLEFTKISINLNRMLGQSELKTSENKNISLNSIEDVKSIEIKNISYKYPRSNDWILNQFSYKLIRSNVYVLKGRSGKGKSTLAKIICGELELQCGEILFNNIKLNTVKNINSHISLTGKESKIFNTTILENLLYANDKATMNEIEEACRKTEIYDMIQNLPDKYNTIIGENGLKLSGGERQRLALARVFLRRDCSVFILDEATSEIGSDMELRIIKELVNCKFNKIIMLITHRDITLGTENLIHI